MLAREGSDAGSTNVPKVSHSLFSVVNLAAHCTGSPCGITYSTPSNMHTLFRVLIPAVCKKDSNLSLHFFNNCFEDEYSKGEQAVSCEVSCVL